MPAWTLLEPRTPQQWQAAADAAEAYLMLDSATQYGLIRGGPVVNVERCLQIIREAAAHGVTPRNAGVDEHLRAALSGGDQ